MIVTKNIVKLPKATVDVQVTVAWSELEPKWNEVFAKLAAEVEFPGFRKGTAPANMVEPKILPQVQQEFLRVVMPQALIDALQGTNIVPIDYPNYQVTSFTKGFELKFSAKLTERPVVTVGSYKTIKPQKPPVKAITDEDVSKIIEDLFKRWQLRQAPATNAAAPQTPPAPSAQPGAGSLSFNNTAAVPAQPAAPQTPAGQPDDNFAKAMGAQTLIDLKTKIKTDLENEAKYNNELDYEEAILQEVEKMTNVDIPDVLVADEINRMLLSLQRNVSERGLLLEEYLKGQNKTVEQIKTEWKPQAEKNVKMELGLSEIARQENVDISDDELQAEIDKIQDQKVKAQFTNEQPRMHLRHALRQTKTLTLLKGIVG